MSPARHGPRANPRTDATPGPVTPWQRLSQSFLRPPADRRAAKQAVEPPDFYRMTDDDKRSLIVRIDPTERKIGIAASILGVALAIYAYVPYMIRRVKVPMTVKPVGKTCPSPLTYTLHPGKAATCNGIYPPSHYLLYLVIALVLAIAIYVTVRIRRRTALAFTTIMTGLAFGQILILVPFGIAGGWVMLRAWRTQKYGSPSAKLKVEGWTPPPPRGTTRRATSSGPGRGTRRRKGEDTTSSSRKPPSQNKRYTPKSPPKKKVSRPTS